MKRLVSFFIVELEHSRTPDRLLMVEFTNITSTIRWITLSVPMILKLQPTL